MAAVFAVVVVVTKPIAGAVEIARGPAVETWTSCRRSVEIGAGIRKATPGHRPKNLKTKRGLLIQLESSVEPCELIVPLDEVVTGSEKADVRFPAHVVLQPKHRNVGVRIHETEVHRVGAIIGGEVCRRRHGAQPNTERSPPALR